MPAIVFTRPNGKVSITRPSNTLLAWMGNGGRWNGFDPGFADRQIDKLCEEGISWCAASRYVRAMQFGGCTSAEAWGIIRDRFCGHLGTGFELWSDADIPSDRWFRDAWRRSHNGGPIGLDLKMAKKIQLQRLSRAAHNTGAFLQIGRWRDRIRQAKDGEELRRVWPKGLESR